MAQCEVEDVCHVVVRSDGGGETLFCLLHTFCSIFLFTMDFIKNSELVSCASSSSSYSSSSSSSSYITVEWSGNLGCVEHAER